MTVGHPKFGLVAIELITATAMTGTMITAATQRPGWRTGTALISLGRNRARLGPAFTGAVGRVIA